jgi:hypothetical protein
MLYIEAQIEPTTEQQKQILTKSIFLAGGITNVENWQAKATKTLSQIDDLYIINPRGRIFDRYKKEWGYLASRKQIEWEFDMLDRATQLLFWFSYETIQPIALYELGARLMERRVTGDEGHGYKPIFIGAHPDYERVFDLKVQVACVDYKLAISDSLEGLLQRVITYNQVLLNQNVS